MFFHSPDHCSIDDIHRQVVFLYISLFFTHFFSIIFPDFHGFPSLPPNAITSIARYLPLTAACCVLSLICRQSYR